MTLSNEWENRVRDRLFRNDPGNDRPAQIHVALATAAILETDTGSTITEPSGNNYSRVQTDPGNANWADDGAGQSSNVAVIQFPVPSGSWGTVTHFALVDAASAGNIVGYGTLDTPRAIDNGADVEFAAGALTISVN